MAALAAACGDDGGASPATPTPATVTPGPSRAASPEEAAYFDQLKSVLDSTHERDDGTEAFRKSAFDVSLGEEQVAKNAAEYARRYQADISDAIAELDDIDPPFGLDAAHAALATAAGERLRLGEEMAAAMEESPVTTDAAFRDLFYNLDGVVREQHFSDSCFDLQAQANARGANVDLECSR